MSLKYITKDKFPDFLSEIRVIDPKIIPINAFARVFCSHCGLYARAILCPPYLCQTYPQFETIKSSREWFRQFTEAYLYIWKNDGTQKWWNSEDDDNYKYIDLVKRKGRALKGCEASGSKYIQKIMRRIQIVNKKRGYDVFCFVTGNCALCSGKGHGNKCENRDNPPCKKGGLVSLEAGGINVYHLLRKLKIDYQYPVVDYLTLVTLMVVK